jgi:hypothetical protein
MAANLWFFNSRMVLLIEDVPMPTQKITLTREELYEKVWTTPMLTLAAEFGFSDRGLAKLCGRHRVPVPPRGYWARFQVGEA